MDPWLNPDGTLSEAYTRAMDQARAAEHERDNERRKELTRAIQRLPINGAYHSAAQEIADLIVSLEKRVARLESESYARTL